MLLTYHPLIVLTEIIKHAGGLSANDMETQFYDAGADDYVMKPFPCRVDQLRQELLRIVSKKSALFTGSKIFSPEDSDETEVTSSTPST
jgi:DNA-binding response OmpR family regulator